jgi:hypothetical protein
VNVTRFEPACPARVSVASVIVRMHCGWRRSLRAGARQRCPTRRPPKRIWIAILSAARWSSRNENTVPVAGCLRAVRAVNGVEADATANLEGVSRSPEILAVVALPAPPFDG